MLKYMLVLYTNISNISHGYELKQTDVTIVMALKTISKGKETLLPLFCWEVIEQTTLGTPGMKKYLFKAFISMFIHAF